MFWLLHLAHLAETRIRRFLANFRVFEAIERFVFVLSNGTVQPLPQHHMRIISSLSPVPLRRRALQPLGSCSVPEVALWVSNMLIRLGPMWVTPSSVECVNLCASARA